MYALLFSDKRKDVITAAFSVGVGFAMIENLIVLTQNINSADIGFAIIRGFCSGLMHSICTIAISYFIPFIRKKKKFFIAGIIMTLNLAIVYHSVYNLLVQSSNSVTIHIGLFMPIATYIIINLNIFLKKNNTTKTKKI